MIGWEHKGASRARLKRVQISHNPLENRPFAAVEGCAIPTANAIEAQ